MQSRLTAFNVQGECVLITELCDVSKCRPTMKLNSLPEDISAVAGCILRNIDDTVSESVSPGDVIVALQVFDSPYVIKISYCQGNMDQYCADTLACNILLLLFSAQRNYAMRDGNWNSMKVINLLYTWSSISNAIEKAISEGILDATCDKALEDGDITIC